MYQPLENAAQAFAEARDEYMQAAQAQDAHKGALALRKALYTADSILTFLGMVHRYECGDCESCKTTAAERAAEMQAAVDADPAFAGPHLSEDEEATARALLADAFDRPTRDES